jgi:hypothetical protein
MKCGDMAGTQDTRTEEMITATREGRDGVVT